MKETWNKLKKWQKIGLVLLALAIIGAVGKQQEEKNAPAPVVLTAAQQDSFALVKRIKEGETNARVNLKMYVTKTLNDPKSLDVLRQEAFYIGDSSLVSVMEYTAKNMYGGVVRKTIRAETTLDGKLVKIIE